MRLNISVKQLEHFTVAKHTSKIDLSIIVPAFNEEEGVESTIIRIYKDASSSSINRLVNTFEVIAVDDGSYDNTHRILASLKKRYKGLKVIRHRFNKGLGASIMTGAEYSKKKYITYLPADGQVFLSEIMEGIQVAPLSDLVLTYRGKREGYNPYRHFLSNSLMISMKLFFGLNFKDYNWVHIYNRNLLRTIKTKSMGVFYLAEVVVRAKKEGLKILEAQAEYHPRSTGYSKNAKPRIVIRTLIDLLKLWIEVKLKPYLK